MATQLAPAPTTRGPGLRSRAAVAALAAVGVAALAAVAVNARSGAVADRIREPAP